MRKFMFLISLALISVAGCERRHDLIEGAPVDPSFHFPEPIPTPTPHKGGGVL